MRSINVWGMGTGKGPDTPQKYLVETPDIPKERWDQQKRFRNDWNLVNMIKRSLPRLRATSRKAILFSFQKI